MSERKTDKEFGLTTFSLNNTTTVFVLTAIIVILGISAYVNMPKENFPEVEQPTVYIGTVYPGNSPIDIENLITREIEKEVNTITGVDEIRSTSMQGYSTIIVEFITGTDVQEALIDVKDKVDEIRSDLPDDLPAEPDIFELNFSEFPILNINLSGDYSLDELKDYAEYIQDEVEKFPEISYAEIRGVDEKELRIKVDPHKMEARKVSFRNIEEAIQYENVTISGGNLKTGDIRRTIRIVGEFDQPDQLLDIIVKHDQNNIVYLRDIATVEFDYVEKENYARLANEPVVMVDVVKRSGENLLLATENIMTVIEKAKQNVFPDDLVVSVTNDQSEQTRDQVNNLENSIIFGMILVVLVLLFFLGTRNALFVGLAIPLSMFTSFMILGAFGITINMMVLFSLIMALGMLVDNGIVVVENVYRLMEQGMTPLEATKKGVGEVAMPIVSSTATTLAAFLPLAFWPGLMGEFMKYLPITLIITLGSSLFVALVINPVFISTFMKLDDKDGVHHGKLMRWTVILAIAGAIFLGLSFATASETKLLTVLGNLLFLSAALIPINIYLLMPASRAFQQRLLPWLEDIYSRTLKTAVSGFWNPMLFFIGTFVLLILSIGVFAVSTPDVLFFPDNIPKYVNVFIEYPVGTDIEKTNETTLKIEGNVREIIDPYEGVVESVITNVGEGTADPNDMNSIGQGATPYKSRITINFKEYRERGGVDTEVILKKLRDGISAPPGATVTVAKDYQGPPVGPPISVEISGENLERLIEISDEVKTLINGSTIQGIERLRRDVQVGKPELIVNIDRDRARRFGVSTQQVAGEIRTALFGKEISKFKQGEDDYDIELRLDDRYRYDLEALMNKQITFRDQSNGKIVQIPISAIATPELSSTYGSIKRKDLDRVVTLSSNVLSGYNATEITNEIRQLLEEEYVVPTGFEIKFTGEQEEQAKEMAFLSQALMLAVFLIFLIIVSQFNKVTSPFIIMASVLFSTIGVFIGLVVFRMEFIVIMTMIGIISLAGIVVNNAIVLIDFIELIRARKREEKEVSDQMHLDGVREAIIEAGKTRMRPVLLTAITTVLGLIPLAVGINLDFIQFFQNYNLNFYLGGDNVIFWGPMSWTIIFGLTFATFLTLVIVPVMYLLVEMFRRYVARLFGKSAKSNIPPKLSGSILDA